MKYYLFIIIGIISIISLSLPLCSASIEKQFEKGTLEYGKISLIDCGILGSSCWLGGQGTTKEEITLIDNTNVCVGTCFAIKNITLYSKGKLVDSVRFETILNGERIKQPIKNYQFYIKDKGKWLPYNYEELPAGNYVLKLEGKKDFGKTVDWIITSQGVEIDDWAIWSSGGILSYYRFNEGSGTLASNSVNLLQYNLTVANSWDNGILSNAYKSEGNIYANSSINLQSSTNWTINFWINKSGTIPDTNNGIFMAETGGGFMLVYVSGGNMTFEEKSSTLVGSKPTNGTWMMYTAVFSTSNLTIYENGAWKKDNTVAFNNTIIHAYVFGNYAGANKLINASIDEMGIWNRSLSASEITELYNSGAGLPYASSGVELISPLNNSYSHPTTTFNCSAYTDGIIVNMSLFTNSTGTWHLNKTNSVSGTINSTTFTNNYIRGSNFIWTCQACYDDLTCDFASENRTVTISKISENSQTYNLTTYDTSTENFMINVSSDGTQTISASLIYAGTSYSSTKTGDNSEMRFSKSLIIPAVTVQTNNTFYWNISYGSTIISSNSYNQTVNPINFSICNGLKIPYINFTFIDEGTLTAMNGTIDTSTWTYWLGDGSTTKSYLFSNLSIDNPSYAFCFSPPDRTLNYDVEMQYSYTGYPQRRYAIDSGSLTNSTTNKILYLLSSSDGIYSTYITSTSTNIPISNTSITIERQFSGVWTIIEQGITGSDGSTTFWLNPNYDHRITAIKTGYTTTQVTLRPTQSVYTIVMGGGVSNATYSSILEGIRYSFYPKEDFLNSNTTYLFGFNITSSSCNLIRYKLELSLSNYTILNYTEGTSSCGSNISLYQNTGDLNMIYARYYIDIGDGYFDISPAKYPIANVTAGEGSVWDAMTKLINYRTGSIADYYGQLWWVFFLTFVLLAVLCYSTGAELTNPGIILPIILLLIFGLSLMGFFQMNLTGTLENPGDAWFDNFGIFVIALCLCMGYTFKKLAE